MALDMYKPQGSSKMYMYIFFFASVLLTWAIYAYTRPLVVENVCSDVSLKTSSLSSFTYDPYADFDYTKAKCIDNVLSK